MIDADTFRETLIGHISGYKPALSGTLCDLCSGAFEEGDEVHVEAHHTSDGWQLVKTFCTHHGDEPPQSGPGAIVRCEVGPVIDGEWAPLYNPEIVSTHQPVDA